MLRLYSDLGKKKMKYSLILFIFLLTSKVSNAKVISGPSNESYISENSEYIYVRWVEDKKEMSVSSIFYDTYHSTLNIKKSDFPKNGLYQFKTKKYLWKAQGTDDDLLTAYDSFIPLDSGEFVVEYISNQGSREDAAFKIYQNGLLKKIFYVKDFCFETDRIPRFFTDFHWLDFFTIDNKNNNLIIGACHKRTTVSLGASITTSSIRTSSIWESWSISNAEIRVFAVFCLLAVILWKLYQIPIRQQKKSRRILLIISMVLISVLLLISLGALILIPKLIYASILP